VSTPAKIFPTWAFFSVVINGILILAIALLILRQQGLTAFLSSAHSATPVNDNSEPQITPAQITSELGRRHKLSYWQWVDVLKKEAKVATDKPPENLSILAGDSLSLWFPTELLPEDRNWLNQGISGETSNGLLKRLGLFDRTQPKTIFVMIGINDLIRGASDETISDNQQQIISYLRRVHPKAQIVVQSILPHGGEEATWERREKLLAISNSRIRKLNQQLQDIATKENVKYLNLHSLFTNKQGDLRPEFSTDGLHLSPQGYFIWRSALQMYTQIELDKADKAGKADKGTR
jgi:lysophospholipase L1-like esterase